MTYTIAIDEAGRGPVIGPLVMAGVLIDEVAEARLKELGVKDSKLLPEEKRLELFDKITTLVKDYVILSISAEELDQLMQRKNLNMIEAMKSVDIINQLNGTTVILDCPSVNVQAYANVIRANIDDKSKVIDAQHKADEKYVSVGAASILAKVTRDNNIKELKEHYQVDFGSGYMSDQKTQTFLDENFEKYPELFRKSWKSWQERNNKKNQKSLGEF